jgi:hypothetical protein
MEVRNEEDVPNSKDAEEDAKDDTGGFTSTHFLE